MSNETTPKLITEVSFLMGDLGTLRGVHHAVHGHVWSIRDFINKVKDRPYGHAYGTGRWRDMRTGTNKHELAVVVVVHISFPKTAGNPIPCTDVAGLLQVLEYIPGKKNISTNKIIMQFFTRFLAGDLSLIQIIESNHNSSNPINVMARKCLENNTTISFQRPPTKKIPTRFIYATQTPAFPCAVKIGWSGNVQKRLSSGNTFIRLAPHSVVAVAPSLNYKRDERSAHAFFADKRLKGEFFNVSIDEVREYFKTIQTRYNDELEAVMAEQLHNT